MKQYQGLTVTVVGSSHLRAQKPCQDKSAAFGNYDFSAIVVCDGHGGEKHFRSEKGAEIAVSTAQKVVPAFVKSVGKHPPPSVSSHQWRELEKRMVFDWRETVEKDYAKHRFSHQELAAFSSDMQNELNADPYIAYGTTLLLAVMCAKHLFLLQLGDGDCVLFRAGTEEKPIKDDPRCAFGRTASLCDRDALAHIRDCIFADKHISGCVLSTDGVKNSFENEEYYLKFCQTLLSECRTNKKAKAELQQFLPQLSKNGSGDDVSIAVLFRRIRE